MIRGSDTRPVIVAYGVRDEDGEPAEESMIRDETGSITPSLNKTLYRLRLVFSLIKRPFFVDARSGHLAILHSKSQSLMLFLVQYDLGIM